MTFISYAQNYEDVMLWRALRQVENGFYIDVGANDPLSMSITRAFYDKGWHGINIEPVPECAARLAAERSRDITLQLCAGATSGTVVLYDIPNTQLATIDEDVVAMHRENGREVRTLTAQIKPLSKICAEHVKGEIHFLKIDVEGAEQSVLQGMDFARWRPWIVLVEATTPTTINASYQPWEPLLLNARYEFAYFDGLNRFYIAAEHAELKPAFSHPPGLRDDFIKYDIAAMLAQATANANEFHLRAVVAEDRVRRMRGSFSWRCTSPLRWLRRQWENIAPK